MDLIELLSESNICRLVLSHFDCIHQMLIFLTVCHSLSNRKDSAIGHYKADILHHYGCPQLCWHELTPHQPDHLASLFTCPPIELKAYTQRYARMAPNIEVTFEETGSKIGLPQRLRSAFYNSHACEYERHNLSPNEHHETMDFDSIIVQNFANHGRDSNITALVEYVNYQVKRRETVRLLFCIPDMSSIMLSQTYLASFFITNVNASILQHPYLQTENLSPKIANVLEEGHILIVNPNFPPEYKFEWARKPRDII